MIFNYHPILGLQYSCEDMSLIYLDSIPPATFSIEEWLYYVKKMGVMILDSSKPITPVENITGIWSNF